MNDHLTLAWSLLLCALSVVGMQLVLLLRKPKFETPADMDARLTLIERNLQAVVQGQGRIDGACQSLERRLQALAVNMGGKELAASRKEIDEQLSRTIDEGRSGRADLMKAFQAFGGEQDLRQTALGASLTRQFSEFQRSTSDALEGSRRVINEQLTNSTEEARKGRAELSAAFANFEAGLEQRINGLDLSLTARFERLQQRLAAQLDETGKTLMAHLAQAGGRWWGVDPAVDRRSTIASRHRVFQHPSGKAGAA